MENLGQFVGTHALLLFAVLASIMLAVTALAWHALARWGEGWWRGVVRGWLALLNSRPMRMLLQRYPVLHRLRENRFVVGGYVGVHSVVGFAIVVAALALFAELADEIDADADLVRFDAALATTLAQRAVPAALQAFHWVTRLGNTLTLVVLGCGVAALLALRRQWLAACGWSIALAGNGLLNVTLKAIFQRTRPLHEHGLLVETGWSFPSGHASGSLVAYGMLAYLLVRATPRAWHLPVVCAAVALILLIGFSRVFLHVHYFSDVLAGYVSGMAWLAVCIAGVEIAQRHLRRRERTS